MGNLQCWRCGANLAALSLPLTRLDECPECAVHLHVCRMCEFFDPAVTKACREDDAEEVRDKQSANFCDYFKPADDSFDPKLRAQDQEARSKLNSLFGDDEPESPESNDANSPDDLFGD